MTTDIFITEVKHLTSVNRKRGRKQMKKGHSLCTTTTKPLFQFNITSQLLLTDKVHFARKTMT